MGQARKPLRSLTTSMSASPGRGQPYSLQFPRAAGDRFTIGRDASCDLAISDMTVSRQHAQLERTPEGWLLSDLESTNGTRVNGWRVRGQVPVRAGDLVSFGNLEVVFSSYMPLRGDDPPAPPAHGGGFAAPIAPPREDAAKSALCPPRGVPCTPRLWRGFAGHRALTAGRRISARRPPRCGCG